MKTFRTALLMLCAGVLAMGSPGAAAKDKPNKQPVIWPADKIAWMEAKNAPPGVMYANLWGEMDKGAHGALVKLPAGSKHPLHTHTSEVKAVVMSGTFWYQAEGGEVQRLGPGSYLLIPAGVKHSSGTGDDGTCELFQQSPGKFDLIPVEGAKK